MRGCFIAIEGLDGCGKSTQIELLRTRFQASRQTAEYLHFPRFDCPYYGDLIARFLRGEFGGVETVHPYLVAILYAGDRKDAAGTIAAWLDAGHHVIVDRYAYSNVAFQAAKVSGETAKAALTSWILGLEFDHHRIPRPDLSIFLNVPMPFILRNLAASRHGRERAYLAGKQDIHEGSADLQERVLHEYLRTAEQTRDLVKLDCWGPGGSVLPPDEIHSLIWRLIQARCGP
jgi:dTMP kinase